MPAITIGMILFALVTVAASAWLLRTSGKILRETEALHEKAKRLLKDIEEL